MSLSFKILFLAFILGSFVPINAQEKQNEDPKQTENRRLVTASAGGYWAHPLGNSFIENGVDLNIGFAGDLRVYILPRVTLGAHYNFIRGNVVNIEATGNYDHTNLWVLGGTIGYDLNLIPKVNLHFIGGAGTAVYRNQVRNIKFTDRGLALWFAPELTYSFNKNLAFYLALQYRYDRMNIDVPAALENAFNNVNYLSIGAGIRVGF